MVREDRKEEGDSERVQPGYTREDLINKLSQALQRTLSTSALDPDGVIYRLIKAIKDTVSGKELFK